MTYEAAHAEFAESSIQQVWEASGYDDFWLRLVTDQLYDFARLEAAVEAANDVAAQRGGDIVGYAVTPCPRGFAIQIGPTLEWATVLDWVRQLVASLTQNAVGGRVEGVVGVLPSTILAASLPPTPTLFARLGLSPTVVETDHARWEVEATQTRDAVSTALDWALDEPGAVILTQDLLRLPVDVDVDLGPLVTRVLDACGSAHIDVVNEREPRARRAVLGPWASVLFQDVGRPWRYTVAELRDLAIRLPYPLDFAFIRVAHRGVFGVTGLDSAQPLPGIRERHVRYNGNLLDRYLPDAHGIQIVSASHLDAARDLSDWDVADLGHDRYLVAADDLEPWYAAGVPDPRTLAKARDDWDGAILNESVISANRNWHAGSG